MRSVAVGAGRREPVEDRLEQAILCIVLRHRVRHLVSIPLLTIRRRRPLSRPPIAGLLIRPLEIIRSDIIL